MGIASPDSPPRAKRATRRHRPVQRVRSFLDPSPVEDTCSRFWPSQLLFRRFCVPLPVQHCQDKPHDYGTCSGTSGVTLRVGHVSGFPREYPVLLHEFRCRPCPVAYHVTVTERTSGSYITWPQLTAIVYGYGRELGRHDGIAANMVKVVRAAVGSANPPPPDDSQPANR